MTEFKMHSNLIYRNSLEIFLREENVNEKHFIITNEFLFSKYIQPLNLNCKSLFIEHYGKGEPTSDMVDNIRKDLPEGIEYLIAIGGGYHIPMARQTNWYLNLLLKFIRIKNLLVKLMIMRNCYQKFYVYRKKMH